MRRPRRSSSKPGKPDGGSIFVDAMVAAVIVALALGSTFGVIADSARRGRDLEARRLALLVAQSELAATGAAIPLRAGETSGVSNDLLWRVEISPYSDGVDSGPAGTLWRVTVIVGPHAGGADLVSLNSLRLGPAPT